MEDYRITIIHWFQQHSEQKWDLASILENKKKAITKKYHWISLLKNICYHVHHIYKYIYPTLLPEQDMI